MGSPTTRLGLLKPAGTDIVNVLTQINANYDKIDQWAGAILVNDGVTPPDNALFDGAIIKEKTSGIVWAAQWNGTGYDKKYIRYPWRCRAFGLLLNSAVANDRTLRIANINALNGAQLNSAGALRQLSGDNWTIDLPVKGLYHIQAAIEWGIGTGAAGSADYRAVTIWRLSSSSFSGHDVLVEDYYGGYGGADRKLIQSTSVGIYDAGESLRVGAWQNSGSARDIGTTYLDVTLLYPAP